MINHNIGLAGMFGMTKKMPEAENRSRQIRFGHNQGDTMLPNDLYIDYIGKERQQKNHLGKWHGRFS